MANNYYMIQMNDTDAAELLKKLAQHDLRTLGNEVAWLIRQEWARRYSQPNPGVTVGEAMEAAKEDTDNLPADEKFTSTEQP